MIYSKFAVGFMFALSIGALLTGIYFLAELIFASVLFFLIFILTTYVYAESIYSERKWRKSERKPKPVKILHHIKSGEKLK